MLAGGNANLAVASAAACTAPDGVICATTRGRHRLTDTRFCRIEDVAYARIYTRPCIIYHDSVSSLTAQQQLLRNLL